MRIQRLHHALENQKTHTKTPFVHSSKSSRFMISNILKLNDNMVHLLHDGTALLTYREPISYRTGWLKLHLGKG
jgi:hypothetical protein